MSEKLGKIEKPSVATFPGRKLYCVPLVFADKDALEDYLQLYERYWEQASEHITNLEKAGKIQKIYHENVFFSGNEGIETIQGLNEKSFQLVKSKCVQGAELQALEDKALFDEYMDWSMCLLVVGRSQNVVKTIQDFYQKTGKQRDEYVVKRINETLAEGEAGLLLTSDQQRIRIQPNLASDIHVFLVSPPTLNDIQQFFREKVRSQGL
jgi:hypothetical protein